MPLTKKAFKHVWMIEEAPAEGVGSPRKLWTKIGVALENIDGSWSLNLSAVPVTGRMVIRDASPTTKTKHEVAQ